MKNRHKKLWRKETETDKSSCTKKERNGKENVKNQWLQEKISVFFLKRKRQEGSYESKGTCEVTETRNRGKA